MGNDSLDDDRFLNARNAFFGKYKYAELVNLPRMGILNGIALGVEGK